ncbi:hypothetical protein OGAPHI_002224 [Ogataea philodendri]|uniref:Uncharacterized protein n=1 Tax=Ogataea philodendri TaxID=1378263 RepID=A0A9P8PBE6_9ASCO|nr:uncharacterized protein OGAPHI_002224 [Ogataea philodendri]KAH3668470.1 hypothetical protein OGAPHI_002224 [Ogataea philodendri]
MMTRILCNSSSSIFKNLLGFSSIPQRWIRSSDVNRVCLLEATKINTGFVGECCLMAINAGLFMVFINGQNARLSGNPSMYICNGTGRTLGGKLNKPSLTPSHPAMSMALETAVDSPNSLTGRLVKEEIKFNLLTMISRIGPLSLASK